MFSERELINELAPKKQLDARMVHYIHRPKVQFHQVAIKCTGGTLVTDTHFICDTCGEEEEI